MLFFPFLCSAIQDLDLGILKMLIRVCFRDLLIIKTSNLLICPWHDSQLVQ